MLTVLFGEESSGPENCAGFFYKKDSSRIEQLHVNESVYQDLHHKAGKKVKKKKTTGVTGHQTHNLLAVRQYREPVCYRVATVTARQYDKG